MGRSARSREEVASHATWNARFREKVASQATWNGRFREKVPIQVTWNALAENDRTFQRAAAAVEALARFGGRDDIADKVRPSARRPGLPAEEEVEPTPAPEG
ncbi:MAG: hypothetical protein U0183_34515 [Polyangiaceae bacterium]